MFKGLLLAGALVALSPIAAHAAEPESDRSLLLKSTETECKQKAANLFAPPMALSPAGLAFLTTQRGVYVTECVAVAVGPINALAAAMERQSLASADETTRLRWIGCLTDVEPSPDWRVAGWVMRLAACTRVGQ